MASVVTEARDIIALAAGPRRWSDSVKAYVNRGARVLGITPGRPVSIWYAKVDDLRATEWVYLQQKAAELRGARQEQRMKNNDLQAELLARRAVAAAEQSVPVAVGGVRAEGPEGGGQGAVVSVPRRQVK